VHLASTNSLNSEQAACNEKKRKQCRRPLQNFQNFNELILPDVATAAAEKNLMELPGILKINNQFFIKIDDTALLLSSNVNSLEQAIAWLVVYYHVLNLNSPPPSVKVCFWFPGKKNLKLPQILCLLNSDSNLVNKEISLLKEIISNLDYTISQNISRHFSTEKKDPIIKGKTSQYWINNSDY
jgi:hypothetical protein